MLLVVCASATFPATFNRVSGSALRHTQRLERPLCPCTMLICCTRKIILSRCVESRISRNPCMHAACPKMRGWRLSRVSPTLCEAQETIYPTNQNIQNFSVSLKLCNNVLVHRETQQHACAGNVVSDHTAVSAQQRLVVKMTPRYVRDGVLTYISVLCCVKPCSLIDFPATTEPRLPSGLGSRALHSILIRRTCDRFLWCGFQLSLHSITVSDGFTSATKFCISELLSTSSSWNDIR